jgi:hypothetical protein
MYCPNCTTEISTGQRYCRSCGVDLQEVSLALGGPRHIEGLGTGEETKPERRVSKSTKFRRLGLYFAILGAVVIIKLNLVAGSLLMLIAVCFMVSSYFARLRSPKTTQSTTSMKEFPAKLRPMVADSPKPSESTMSTNELSPESPVPSVTERTTNLLEGHRPEGSRTESGSDA